MGQVILSGVAKEATAPVKLLEGYTWGEIRAISDAGTASNYWSVGDTKTIVIDGQVGNTTFSNLEIDVFILGIDHNSAVEGTNRIHFGLGKVDGVYVSLVDDKYLENCPSTPGYFTMNTSQNNTQTNPSGGWASCHMRKTILGSDSTPTNPTANTLLAALPADLRNVMKSVIKYTDNVGAYDDVAGNVTATTDYLWLLAEFEVKSRFFGNTAEQNYQKRYDYFSAGNIYAAYRFDAPTVSAFMWTRTHCVGYREAAFCIVQGAYNTTSSLGIAPVFAV